MEVNLQSNNTRFFKNKKYTCILKQIKILRKIYYTVYVYVARKKDKLKTKAPPTLSLPLTYQMIYYDTTSIYHSSYFQYDLIASNVALTFLQFDLNEHQNVLACFQWLLLLCLNHSSQHYFCYYLHFHH